MKTKIVSWHIISLLTCIVLNNIIHPQVKSEKRLTTEPQQNKKVEWEIELKANWKNPYIYTDIAVDMVLNSPNGKELILPCFYESGKSGKISKWKARFAPEESGDYSYHFQLSKKEKLITKSKNGLFTVTNSNERGFLRTNNYWSFRFDNGDIFRGIGENIGWESRNVDDSKYFKELHENPKFNYEIMLRKLSENGGNFFRTWMCQWNLPLEWKKVSNNSRYADSKVHFNPSVMPKMDRLFELCDSLGVYVMLAMDSHVNLMGDFWKNNNYNILNGGPAKTPTDFFTNTKSKIQYKSRLRYLVARWGYSPSIAAWEFFNEIDNASYNGKDKPEIADSIIVEWHTEMSSYLKKIDLYKHLATTSISHRDVKDLNSIPDIDLNQKHIYVNVEAIPSTINNYLEKYGKPYVIGEFAHHWDWSLNFNDYAEEFDYDFKRGLWFGLFSPTPILPMTWWWEFFDMRNIKPYYAKVKKISDEMITAGKGDFKQIDISTDRNEQIVHGVKCGSKMFVYLLNNTDSTITYNIIIKESMINPFHIRTYKPEKELFENHDSFVDKRELGIAVNGIILNGREEALLIIE